MNTGEYSLSKYIAVCGAASRRHSTDLIKAGKVTVDGVAELNPGTRVTEQNEVFCEGKKVAMPRCRHYIMLHKPRGYVCTSEDEHAEKKAIDLIQLPDGARLYSAGRLDKDSEGLILFSNDGDFVNTLTHPRNGIRKTYEVSMKYELTCGDVRRMTEGIRDNGECLRALRVDWIRDRKYRLILGEGKNREIRRMAEALRNEAVRLKRVAVGSLYLGSLPCGAWRELTEEERSLAFTSPEAANADR